MSTTQTQTTILQKAKENLAQLQATLSPDIQLLNGLRDELATTLAAGANVRQIWVALRAAGFQGNQTKLADWLQVNGLREKQWKKGMRGDKRKQAENQAAEG